MRQDLRQAANLSGRYVGGSERQLPFLGRSRAIGQIEIRRQLGAELRMILPVGDPGIAGKVRPTEHSANAHTLPRRAADDGE